MDWLNDTVQALQSQEEQFEADLEALGPKPTNKARGHSAADLNTFITRHRHHVAMLERVLRLLENDQVAPEEVETALKDSMEYYLESSTEPDFMADDDMYEGLPVNEVRPRSWKCFCTVRGSWYPSTGVCMVCSISTQDMVCNDFGVATSLATISWDMCCTSYTLHC
jgi:CCR4-NOT transcriptional regulation complex NOT5 subunit